MLRLSWTSTMALCGKWMSAKSFKTWAKSTAVWRSVTLTWRQPSSGANIMKRLAVPLRAAVVPPAHSEEFAHVRQKYDQGCYGGCNTTLDERRPRARKRWHRKYVHRHRGANGA